MTGQRASVAALALVIGSCAPPAPEVPALPDLSAAEPQVQAVIRAAHAKLSGQPGSAEAWGYYASLLAVHEFLAEAIPAFETAAALDPDDFRWPYQLAVRLSLNDPEASLEHFEHAVRARDDYAPLQLRYGTLLERMGDTPAARSALQRAVELDRRNAYAHAGLGQLLLADGDLEEAGRHLFLAIRLDPRCQPALSGLAAYWRAAGDLGKADEFAARAASVPETGGPDEVLAAVEQLGVGTTPVLIRAEALAQAGRIRESIEQVRKLVDDNPESVQGRRALGRFLLDDGDHQGAIEQFRAALRTSPDFVAVRLDLAYALSQTARWDEAEQEYQDVLAGHPEVADAHRGLAACLAATGRVEESLESFRKALELAPDDAVARTGYGKALFYAGRYEACLDVLLLQAEAATEPLDRLEVDAVGHAGLALGRVERHVEAAALLSRAVSAAPERVSFRLGWAGALMGSGRDAEAVDVLQRGLDLNARAGRVAVALASVLATSPHHDVRDGPRAVRLAERWVTSTRRRNAAVLDTLACAYAEVGRFDEAIRAAEQALAIASDDVAPGSGASISQHLELFRQGKPYRRPASPDL